MFTSPSQTHPYQSPSPLVTGSASASSKAQRFRRHQLFDGSPQCGIGSRELSMLITTGAVNFALQCLSQTCLRTVYKPLAAPRATPTIRWLRWASVSYVGHYWHRCRPFDGSASTATRRRSHPTEVKLSQFSAKRSVLQRAQIMYVDVHFRSTVNCTLDLTPTFVSHHSSWFSKVC